MTILVKATILYYVEDEDDVHGLMVEISQACTGAARRVCGCGGVVFQKPRRVMPEPPAVNARGGVA